VGLTFRGFLLTFTSRDDADVWWRDRVKAKTAITRVNPQHYTYTGDTLAITNYWDNVFLTQLPWDRAFVIPDANIRDHVNQQT